MPVFPERDPQLPLIRSRFYRALLVPTAEGRTRNRLAPVHARYSVVPHLIIGISDRVSEVARVFTPQVTAPCASTACTPQVSFATCVTRRSTTELASAAAVPLSTS
jgi:hypothetical protein